ncbi:MAG: hypothetical protein ACFB8W_02875 [Elainellaceae cyanobacterium]
MRFRQSVALGLTIAISLLGLYLSLLLSPVAIAAGEARTETEIDRSDLLQPVPTQPIGYYDYFGQLLRPAEVRSLVAAAGLDPDDPTAYPRIGAVEITEDLLAQGEDIFFNRDVGDMFGLQRVFGFQNGVTRLLPEYILAVLRQATRPTDNLRIFPLKPIELGDRTLYPGVSINTGLDLKRHGFRFRTLGDIVQSFLPVGLKLSGDITCAVCHAALNSEGTVLNGVPNGDLNIPLLIALAPNSAAGFARLNFDPLDSQYLGNGKLIIGSDGNLVELPDPDKLERAFDNAVLDVPQGNFESSPDRINNTTQIPTVFTFHTNPFGFDGTFAVGPFAGLSAINNAVHSSEINLLAAAQRSAEILGIDPEVYIGTVLQRAADRKIRLPEGDPVRPSEWLRQVAPELTGAELEDQIPAPGAGEYPLLQPSLFTYNGLIFTPDSGNPSDIASGPFLFANNAMSAWQNSLLPPANRSPENQQALASGSVKRGAKVFEQANCASCHLPPFYTDNEIHPIEEIGTNPARARSRLGLNPFLVPPKLYTFDTLVPPPADAEVLDVPTAGVSATPTTLPEGVLPNGGYKTLPLLGLALSAPYLHDGGVAVGEGALRLETDGSFTVVEPARLGLSATLVRGELPDAASSLRALVDRQLRRQVVDSNRANPALVRSNLEGSGHDYYVDAEAGFTPQEQRDLVNFLLALDDNPGQF